MKLKTLTLSAATAALLATGAYAQDTKPQPATPATPPVATPDQPAANKPMTDSESQMPNAAADKSAPSKGAVTSTKTTTESIQFTSSAGADDLLASELIGTPVRNAKEDKLGDINDVIMGKDGKPAVAVLGVGGFLGIGEKNVGVPFDSLQFTTDNNKKIARLEIDKQALESAPAFVYPEKPAASKTGVSPNTGTTKPPAQ
ncbi:MAG TPA: PRC-barrel domain-containing protein [Hyphomicrobiales bacterium]